MGSPVSIPFKRDGVSEQPESGVERFEFDEFLFPSNGKAFLNGIPIYFAIQDID